MERNFLLTIAYDGTLFHGWQRQPEALTVQGHLESTLSRLFRKDIVINGTSRTDAGVHAYGQRATFSMETGIPADRLARVINNALSGREKGPFAISPVRVVKAEEKPAGFHARFDSKGKKYIYKIKNTPDVDIFVRNYVYHVNGRLDADAMKLAAAALKGTHDFKSFEASGGTERETTVRTIYDIGITGSDEDSMLQLHVSGDGFLYNMVRIITGTLVDVGLGKIPAEDMPEIIAAKDRTKAGHTAPPCGLYLAEVYY